MQTARFDLWKGASTTSLAWGAAVSSQLWKAHRRPPAVISTHASTTALDPVSAAVGFGSVDPSEIWRKAAVDKSFPALRAG
jgi:hypothetical protein